MSRDRLKHDQVMLARTFFERPDRTLLGVKEGWDTIALEFSDGLIARLPRSPAAWDKMKKEAGILANSDFSLSIEVPRTSLIACPLLASWHQKIKGESLTPERYSRLPSVAQQCLANDLADLVIQLQSITIPIREGGELFQQQHLGKLRRFFGSEAGLEWAEYRYFFDRAMVALGSAQTSKIALFAHGDLHGGNLLIDGCCGRLVGVIDFLDAHYGDPAQELSKLAKVSVQLTKDVHLIYESKASLRVEIQKMWYYALIEQLTDMTALSLSPRLAPDRVELVRQLVVELQTGGIL